MVHHAYPKDRPPPDQVHCNAALRLIIGLRHEIYGAWVSYDGPAVLSLQESRVGANHRDDLTRNSTRTVPASLTALRNAYAMYSYKLAMKRVHQ